MPGIRFPGRTAARAVVVALAAALGALAGAARAQDEPESESEPDSPPASPPADAAIRTLEKRAAEDPRDFLTRTMLGEVRARRGRETGDLARFVSAEEAFRDALRLKADHGPARIGLAGALASQHRFREALELVAKVIESDPKNSGAHVVAFDAAMESGQYPRADEALAALGRAAPDSAALLARAALRAEVHGDIDGAIARADKASAAAAQEGADAEARAWYEARCGDLRFHKGDLDGARAHFVAALGFHSAHPAALLGMVAVHRAKGANAEARKILERLAADSPTPGVLFELGDLHAGSGLPEDAARARDRAVALATREGPWRRTYRREMAEFLADEGGDPEQALALAREDLPERGDVHGHGVLAWALFRCGKLDEAAAAMEKALALGTHEPSLWERAALLHLARGEKDQAKALLERVRATGAWFLGDEGRAALKTLEKR